MELQRNMIIRSPSQTSEYDAYYILRWQVLRAPWNQAQGSEKDELEDSAIHRIALYDEKVVACGRIHFIDESTAQIRYMAVAGEYLNKGIGSKVLNSLEQAAKDKSHKTVLLHAREASLGFYTKRGYKLIKKSYLLFNEVQHYEMQKSLYMK